MKRPEAWVGPEPVDKRVSHAHLAHGAGALLVWLYLEVSWQSLELSPLQHRQHWPIDNVAPIVGYLLFAVVVGEWLAHRLARPVKDWVDAQRDPTPEERAATLALPVRLSAMSLGLWAGAAVVFGILAHVLWHDTSRFVVHIVLAIGLGGLMTTAVTYLFTERALRPLFAHALVSGPVERRAATPGIRHRLLLAWGLGSGIPLTGLFDLGLVAGGRRVDLGPPVVTLAAIGVLTGTVLTVLAARSVADPLERIRTGMSRVERGELDVRVPVDDGGEVGLLESGFNRMVDGLRERQRLQDLFGRQVGEQVANLAIERGMDLGGEQCEASAVFVDLVGSTALAQDRPPSEVVERLNRFFATVVAAASAQGGYVSRFEGDGALCVFGAPLPLVDHASRALRAGRMLAGELRAQAIDAGVGVSAGVVVAGNVGTPERYEYTVIGDPVNEAARLTDEAKRAPSRVLASEAAVTRADLEALNWIAGEEIVLRGRTAPTRVYVPAPVTVSSVTEPTPGP